MLTVTDIFREANAQNSLITSIAVGQVGGVVQYRVAAAGQWSNNMSTLDGVLDHLKLHLNVNVNSLRAMLNGPATSTPTASVNKPAAPQAPPLQQAYKAIGPAKKPLSFLDPDEDAYDEYYG